MELKPLQGLFLLVSLDGSVHNSSLINCELNCFSWPFSPEIRAIKFIFRFQSCRGMGSTSRRGEGLPFFESKTPHFFKIILDDVRRLGKLGQGIPRKFVERYGSSIPNSVCLKVPSGESWPVEVSKHGNDVWFQNGWQELVEYYSLDYGHLLLFEHDGGSSFNVLIFDTSATEIRYPTIRSEERKKAGEQRKPVEERAEDDAINGLSISRRARKRSSLPFPCRHKKARNDLTSRGKSTSKPLLNYRKIDSASKIPEEFGGVQPSCQKEKSEALQRASTFRSEHPNFTVVMAKSYVSSYLAIPADFCTTHIGIKQCDVSLSVSDGRDWSAKYKNFAKHSSGRLVSGWTIFVRENNVRVGDVCVFELMDIFEIKLRVSIFRDDENPNIDPSLGENVPAYVEGGAPLIYDSTDQIFDLSLGRKKTRGNGKGKKKTYENVKALLRTNAFKSVNPYFPVTLKRSYIDNGVGLTIPAEFAKKHLTEEQSGVALCVCNGRTWPVRYKREPDQSCFYYGWKEFVKGNGLKDGDVCVFELIEVNKITFKVSIFRANGSMYVNPYFLVTLKPSYIDRVGLAIPAKFAREHLTKNHSDVTLCVPDGRTWPVQYRQNPNRSRFYHGWKEFVKGNGLKAGDHCVFELIDVNEITFKVSIFEGNGSMSTLSA